jgi:hypothetical protein
MPISLSFARFVDTFMNFSWDSNPPPLPKALGAVYNFNKKTKAKEPLSFHHPSLAFKNPGSRLPKRPPGR